jgi:hypothetical protein
MPLLRKQLDLVEKGYCSVADVNGTLAHFLLRASSVHKNKVKQFYAAKKTASLHHAP